MEQRRDEGIPPYGLGDEHEKANHNTAGEKVKLANAVRPYEVCGLPFMWGEPGRRDEGIPPYGLEDEHEKANHNMTEERDKCWRTQFAPTLDRTSYPTMPYEKGADGRGNK